MATSTLLITIIPPVSVDVGGQTFNRTSATAKLRLDGGCNYWVYDKGSAFPHFTIDLLVSNQVEVHDVHYKVSDTEKIQLNDLYRDPAKFSNGLKTSISSEETKFFMGFVKAVGISVWKTPASKKSKATFSMTLST